MARQTWPVRIAILGFLASARQCSVAPAAADPYVTLSWDHGGSTGQQVTTRSYTGPGGYDLYVSLTGQSTPVAGFEVVLIIGGGRGLSCFPYPPPALPTAWHFDDAGCAAGHACFEGGTLVGPSAAAQAGRLFISDISYDLSTDKEKVTFVEDDPMPFSTPDPAQTYQLLHLHFDHTGTCAGEADTANVAIILAHWIDRFTGGTEFAWNIADPSLLGWNAPPMPGICERTPPISVLSLAAPIAPAADGGSGGPVTQSTVPMCSAAVPALPATWGSVKARYR